MSEFNSFTANPSNLIKSVDLTTTHCVQELLYVMRFHDVVASTCISFLDYISICTSTRLLLASHTINSAAAKSLIGNQPVPQQRVGIVYEFCQRRSCDSCKMMTVNGT